MTGPPALPVPGTEPIPLGPSRRQDYDRLPDQPRHELLFGTLYLKPSPPLWHQVIVGELGLHFDRMANASGGVAFFVPLDVHLADHSIVSRTSSTSRPRASASSAITSRGLPISSSRSSRPKRQLATRAKSSSSTPGRPSRRSGSFT
jgi:hypothetical protein